MNILKLDENTVITSDNHFGHSKIVDFVPKRAEFCKNNNYENLDQYMIEEWNKKLSNNQQVLCLGDFAFKSVQSYGNLIKGNNILLPGNHDKNSIDTYLNNGFKHVLRGFNLIQKNRYFIEQGDTNDLMFNCLVAEINGVRILFSHFPVYDTNPYDKKFSNTTRKLEDIFEDFDCRLNIHGHTHLSDSDKDYCFNASIEAVDFKFLTIGEILERATLR